MRQVRTGPQLGDDPAEIAMTKSQVCDDHHRRVLSHQARHVHRSLGRCDAVPEIGQTVYHLSSGKELLVEDNGQGSRHHLQVGRHPSGRQAALGPSEFGASEALGAHSIGLTLGRPKTDRSKKGIGRPTVLVRSFEDRFLRPCSRNSSLRAPDLRPPVGRSIGHSTRGP